MKHEGRIKFNIRVGNWHSAKLQVPIGYFPYLISYLLAFHPIPNPDLLSSNLILPFFTITASLQPFTEDRRMTHIDFPDNISPFPDAGDLLYGNRTAISSPLEIEFRSLLPLQKLRPIRGNRGDSAEYSDCPANFHEVEFREKAESANLLNRHQSIVALPPEIEFEPSLPIQTLPPLRTGGDNTECCSSPASAGEVIEFPEKEGESGSRWDTLALLKVVDTGNRWPQAETLALLKIRSEMDAEFRNAKPKGPLWEIVSR
nr:TPA_asm: hypothetical protein HUJ06_025128 [Nelumbo nucifera]